MSFFRFKKSLWQNQGLHEAVDFSIEIIKIVLISLAIIVPVRYFLIQPFYVKGASMEPNFYNHEYLIIDEISYRFNDPQRGDIIIFHPPNSKNNDFFIKRIIGLPGERVAIEKGKIKIYNEKNPQGVILNESIYLDKETVTYGEVDIALETDEYFMIGDNRVSSLDSRSFGPIVEKNIIGKVWVRGWPFDRIKVFSSPQYNL